MLLLSKTMLVKYKDPNGILVKIRKQKGKPRSDRGFPFFLSINQNSRMGITRRYLFGGGEVVWFEGVGGFSIGLGGLTRFLGEAKSHS